MGRRRKGRAISGWVIVDKPAGPTSTAVVNKVRWAFEAQKAGHAGTLDPAATGLLAIALGETTKVIPHLTDALKAYEFIVNWGAATNTDDADGMVIATSPQRPSHADVIAALPHFTGQIDQVPPQFSAVKVDGQRAYAKARAGEDVEVAARPLFVDSLDLVQHDTQSSTLHMVCGKGGYVRAIGRDLGQTLGCLGHVRSLRRIWSGPFDVQTAVSLDHIEAAARTPQVDRYLRPTEDGLCDLPLVTVNAVAAGHISHGNPADVLSSTAGFGDTCWASHQGKAVALGTYRAGRFQPSRVLNLP